MSDAPRWEPPRLAERALRWWLPDGVLGDSILGDAREEFLEYVRNDRRRLPLALWYWLHALRIAGYYVWRLPDTRELDRFNGHARRSLAERLSPPLTEIRRVTRNGGGVEMGSLIKDLMFAARALARKPSSAIISVVVLSLGIGMSTFMFSLVYGVFFRGLDIPQEDRVATIWRVDTSRPGLQGQQLAISSQDFTDYRDRQTSFEGLAAGWNSTVNVSGTEGPERYAGSFVTANTFDLLRVQPSLGRAFRPGEDTPGSAPTVLLGYEMWQNRYGGDPGVLGEVLRINGEQGTVVGVMPEGFLWPANHQIWITMDDDPLASDRGQGRFYTVFGRLLDGTTWDRASLELANVAQQLEREHPDTNEGMTIRLLTWAQSQSQGPITTLFTAMMVAGLLVLLVACANVANLLLARAALRTKEAAVRVALGAGRLRVMLPFFSEALVLALGGALLGIGIAYYAVGLFDSATAGAVTGRPYFIRFQVDLPVLVFVVGLTGLTALVAGAAPALQVAKTDVNGVLKDESRGSSSFHMGRLSKVLVIGEVALSCALLVAAGLVTKSMVQLSRQEYAFDPDGIFTARVGLFQTDYPDREDRQQFFDDLLRSLEGLPDVRAAGLTSTPPGSGTGIVPIRLEGEVYEADGDRPQVHNARVTSGFFDMLGVGLLQGTDFSAANTLDAERVAIVNQSFSDRFWPGEGALGRRFRTGTTDTIPWMGVIGVVGDLQMEGFSPPGIPGSDPAGYYTPVTQSDPSFLTITAVPTAGPPMGMAADVRNAVRGLDPDLPIFNVRSAAEVIQRSSWFYGVFGTIFIVFGVAALFMASVGLYGVLSFSVSRRVQEMGIRMALGAGSRDVVKLILKQGAAQMAIGLPIGMALAWGVSAAITIIMYQVDPRDVSVFATVFGVIFSIGFLASWIPARRATSVDPMTALRYE